MRLWSIHPRCLDSKGLSAAWREALLAKAVLQGRTKGYKKHPQLIRFRKSPKPISAINRYLYEIWKESYKRGYRFDRDKAGRQAKTDLIPVKRGQVNYEFKHLKNKLKFRNPAWLKKVSKEKNIRPHPLFFITRGGVEIWEKIKR